MEKLFISNVDKRAMDEIETMVHEIVIKNKKREEDEEKKKEEKTE